MKFSGLDKSYLGPVWLEVNSKTSAQPVQKSIKPGPNPAQLNSYKKSQYFLTHIILQ